MMHRLHDEVALVEKLSKKELTFFKRSRDKGVSAKKAIQHAKTAAKMGVKLSAPAKSAGSVGKPSKPDARKQRANLSRLKRKADKKGVKVTPKGRKGKGMKMVFGKWVKVEHDLSDAVDSLVEASGS